MNPESPEVDIILPVHGDALFLAETLESLRNEINSNVHLLVILDRASNEALNKVVTFAQEIQNVRIEESKDPGLVAALNLGINISKAKYVARIDSDDVVDKGRIQAQISFMQQDSRRVMCGTQIRYIDSRSMPIAGTPAFYPSSDRSIRRHIHFRNPFAHPSMLFIRESALKAGGYRDNYPGAEDLDLWFRLSTLGKIGNLKTTYLSYRLSENQFTRVISKEYLAKEDELFDSGLKYLFPKYKSKSSSYAGKLIRTVDKNLGAMSISSLLRNLVRIFYALILAPTVTLSFLRYRTGSHFRNMYSWNEREK